MNHTESPAGLYVHIPFCDGRCGYCVFYSVIYDSDNANSLLSALEKEAGNYRFAPKTIYFGGGTPTILQTVQLERLCSVIRSSFDLCCLKEWTVEANPGTLTHEKLKVLKSAGVTRISIGCQSFDPDALLFLGRRHTVSDSLESINLAREAGFDNLSIDLIASLPGFAKDVWEKTLETAVTTGVDHISVYALTLEEGSLLTKKASCGGFVPLTEDDELRDLSVTKTILGRARFKRYEISNYSKPGKECLHNLDCWRGGEYIGLGPAASSHMLHRRWTNIADIDEYIERLKGGKPVVAFKEDLTPEVESLDLVIFGLRMLEGVSEKHAKPFEDKLMKLAESGFVTNTKGRWLLTEKGLDMADFVALEIMP
ncbi:MAG: radical SAM family heme chaperone HemW [Lentisphaerae bacterium]|nr:radical SAM family heme chaperone HemW [Lentisphaerota bacterium]